MGYKTMSKYILTASGQLYHYEPGESELYHYGVPGMKWGQRKAAYASEKNAYRQAKKDYKTARRELARRGYTSIGIKGLSKYNAARKKADAAELNMIDAKAKYKAAKSKNSAKAEFNTYRKAMQRSGLVGSAADDQSGGRSTKMYNHLKATKGKAYADKVQKKVQNVAIGNIIGTVAVSVGAAVVGGILESKR